MSSKVAKRTQALSANVRRMGTAYASFRQTIPPAHDPKLDEALAILSEQNAQLLQIEAELRAQVAELETASDRAAAESERYKDLFERAIAPYFITDRFGVVLDINARAATLIGPDARALLGRPLTALVPPEFVAALRAGITAAGSDPQPTEVRMTRADGTRGPLLLEFRLVDRGTRVLCAGRETDDRSPALARALRDHVDLLARERQMRVKLERSNSAKDHFMAVLAHDLRGPLNAILGWSDLLMKEFLAKDARDRAVGVIRRNADFLRALIEELLDITRLSSEKMRLDLVPLDLEVEARRVVESMMPLAVLANVTVRVEPAEGDVMVNGDQLRIEQILRNVLSNALHFSTTGGEVRIAVRRECDDVVVRIADDGKGIAPDVLPHIFELLEQDTREPLARDGLGLGLHIVRQLVELHGGRVSAASAGLGHGALFTISFPARVALG